MGLFLGASLLSFVQIAEYFLDETLLCLGCLKKDKMMRNSSGKTESDDKGPQQMTVIENGNAEKNLGVAVVSGTLQDDGKNGYR